MVPCCTHGLLRSGLGPFPRLWKAATTGNCKRLNRKGSRTSEDCISMRGISAACMGASEDVNLQQTCTHLARGAAFHWQTQVLGRGCG